MKVIKKNKFWYYVMGYWRAFYGRKQREHYIGELMELIGEEERRMLEKRVAYYCKAFSGELSGSTFVKDLKKICTPKAYYFDAYQYARYFDEHLPIDYVFGDVNYLVSTPSIVKSRPITDNNAYSVLLNLDKARHFVWVIDDIPFHQKENKLIGRGAIYQQHRYDFFQKYFHHPLCDLGAVNKKGLIDEQWIKPKISIEMHLRNKFVLSLQGNDVATNLKWIMSSNSIAVMPCPTIETWFMEGVLEGGKHYIAIKPDYSDLQEQLEYYIENTQHCNYILEEAHKHCAMFFNQEIETLCSLMVLEKYFHQTA